MEGHNYLEEGLLNQDVEQMRAKQEEFTAFVNSLSANISLICGQVNQIEQFLPKIGTEDDSVQSLKDIKGVIVSTAKSVSLIRQYITQNDINISDFKHLEYQYHSLSSLALNAFDETRERFIEVSNDVVKKKKEIMLLQSNHKQQLVEIISPDTADSSVLQLPWVQSALKDQSFILEEEAKTLQEIEDAVTLEVNRFEYIPKNQEETETLMLEVSGFKPLNHHINQSAPSMSSKMKFMTAIFAVLVLAVIGGIIGFLLIHR